MCAVGLEQRELAANPLDESDLMTCAVEARLACASLYEGAPSVEDRIFELAG